MAEKKDGGPRVLNQRHYPRGSRELANAVYCGRPSKWGNPFVMPQDGTRDEVCDRFEREILPTLDVSELRGKDLICWCAPARCHCDAILRKANLAYLDEPMTEAEEAILDQAYNEPWPSRRPSLPERG